MNIEDIIWQCLNKAVNRFNSGGDRESLLCPLNENPDAEPGPAASERAIAYRLAFYLETELRNMGLISDIGPIVVDCEYNRHLKGEKTLGGI